ncbi:MAG: hypothetical protein BWX80_01998 [Candidatus Hydrogenedentes bacterium ADurb.Bin101]|jgi:hypothetical protein|nr:MAG: hypothetical protein BWX80_01998 [Candidatus Hydrogenedentes bacterium ADurb.Bin101]
MRSLAEIIAVYFPVALLMWNAMPARRTAPGDCRISFKQRTALLSKGVVGIARFFWTLPTAKPLRCSLPGCSAAYSHIAGEESS